ncbi:HEAT repeat domain containing protein [Entamoeba histolytica HM-1:IMSS-B]|nr:HEAT repeat domain containing protein [Entamoeba histolytica HM-1:IMSS-B]
MLFHPTLPLLVVGSNKGSTIRVFDTNSESVVNAWNNLNSGNKSVSGMTWINKTDIPMLVTSTNDGAIRIWRNWEDSGSNVLVSSFKGVMEECLPDIGAKVVGLGESRLLTAGNSMIRIWDLEKEELEANIRMKTSITCVNEYNEFSDHMFLVGNVNGKVTLYDMRLSPQEREVKTWKISHSPIITTSRPSSGNTIIAGAVARLNEPSLAGLIDIRASQIRKLYVPKLTTLVTHPTATYFVCGSAEQFIRSYNSESGKMIQEIKYYDGFFGHRINPVVNMAITQFGFNMAVSSTDSSITLFGFD